MNADEIGRLGEELKRAEHSIKRISHHPTINSRAQLTFEFRIALDDGSFGTGSPPIGETLSRYERASRGMSAAEALAQLEADAMIGSKLTQARFDRYLESRWQSFGRANVFSLSSAYFEASLPPGFAARRDQLPRICLNILNGGSHAYTNPVLSDFHEILIVPNHGDIRQLLTDHDAIQERVHRQLSERETVAVNGNPVHVLGNGGNRDSLRFLNDILIELGLAGDYDIMVDAAAGSLWNGASYAFEIAEKRAYRPEQLVDYWRGLIAEFPIRFVEDPFYEDDLSAWRALVAAQDACAVLGDDVHCGDPDRVGRLLDRGCIHGIVLKPDQAGTITRAVQSIEAAFARQAPVILSHRSVSTDSLVHAHLVVAAGLDHVKFGPLLTDYTAIMRINEILRLGSRGESAAAT